VNGYFEVVSAFGGDTAESLENGIGCDVGIYLEMVKTKSSVKWRNFVQNLECGLIGQLRHSVLNCYKI
jgi:hypothetical protein